jgi:hypothetical protein
MKKITPYKLKLYLDNLEALLRRPLELKPLIAPSLLLTYYSLYLYKAIIT